MLVAYQITSQSKWYRAHAQTLRGPRRSVPCGGSRHAVRPDGRRQHALVHRLCQTAGRAYRPRQARALHRSGAAQTAGVLGLVLGIEPGEYQAGALVDEMDETKIPAGVAHFEPRQMAVPVGDLEAAALDHDGAVTLPLHAVVSAGEGEA